MARRWRGSCAVLAAVVVAGAATAVTPDGPAHAAPDTRSNVHYVAPKGSGPTPNGRCDGGTFERPWASLAESMKCLGPGDVLYIRGGLYEEDLENLHLEPGTRSRPILVSAYPGERVLVRGLVRLYEPTHWILDGINITWDGTPRSTTIILVAVQGGTGWTFRNAEIWGGPLVGLWVSSADTDLNGLDDRYPTDYRITGNCIHDTGSTDDSALGQSHNLYLHTRLASGPGVVERNLFYNAVGGFNVKLGVAEEVADGASDVRLRYNTIHHAAISNVVVVTASRDNRIERNLIGELRHLHPWYPNIRGYKLTGSGNIAIRNGAYDLGSEGIVAHDDSSTARIAAVDNVAVTPSYDSTSRCGGFHPANATARRYGRDAATHRPLVGDWNGATGKAGNDTPAVMSGGVWSLRNANNVGPATRRVRHGRHGDVPVAGDWDGDGTTTWGSVRVVDGQVHWTLDNGRGRGGPSLVFGVRGDRFVVGDWDGDGDDSPGVVRAGGDGRWRWYLRAGSGPDAALAAAPFSFGATGCAPIVGDWDGRGGRSNAGTDTPGVVCDRTWRVRNVNTSGGVQAQWLLEGAQAGDRWIAGDWDGNGDDNPGYVRGGSPYRGTPWLGSLSWYLRSRNSTGRADRKFTFDA